MDEMSEEEFMDAVSDISTDSIQESPTSKIPPIHFSKPPRNVREYAAKVRKIERKIMLGLLSDDEESKLRKSKYLTSRFEKLLSLSRTLKKGNLYKSVDSIYLNKTMIDDLQKKADTTATNLRRKLQMKINSLKSREKTFQEKTKSGGLTQNDVNSCLRDMYFIVKFIDGTALDHNSIYQKKSLIRNIDGKLLNEKQFTDSTRYFIVTSNMPSRIDWRKYLSNLHARHVAYSRANSLEVDQIVNDETYEYIFLCIECLSMLQTFLFDLQVPRCLLTLLRKEMLKKLSSLHVLKLLRDSMKDDAKKKLSALSQSKISSASSWLEHMLYHQLSYAERLADKVLFELKECAGQHNKQENDLKQFKLCRWYDLAGLRPVLVESVHERGCSYKSQEQFEKFFYPVNAEEKHAGSSEKIGSTESGNEEMVCDYCQSTVEKNRFGQREELLICKDCGNKAHPSCLSYSVELVEQIRKDDSWQCIDCKACIVCDGTGDPDTLLFCDACDKGYHMQCHTPKLEQMPSGKWACSICISKGKSVVPTTPHQSVFIIDENEIPKKVITDPAVQPAHQSVDRQVNISHLQLKELEAPLQSANSNPPAAILQSPVLSVPQARLLYSHPGVAYGQLATGTTPVTFSQPHAIHPVPMQIPVNQPHLIPVNYAVLPNGSSAQPIAPVPPPQAVLGKGTFNDLSYILNPKTPLPDVRSSIREDVLRSLPKDVADWTVQDVLYYFKAHGYVQESKLLEEQEIDGRAMLLMSRSDCLTGLRIKLGPALKIYHMHIHKLQRRTDFLG